MWTHLTLLFQLNVTLNTGKWWSRQVRAPEWWNKGAGWPGTKDWGQRQQPGASHPYLAGDSSLGPACPPLTPAAAGSPPVPPAGDPAGWASCWPRLRKHSPSHGALSRGPGPSALSLQAAPAEQRGSSGGSRWTKRTRWNVKPWKRRHHWSHDPQAWAETSCTCPQSRRLTWDSALLTERPSGGDYNFKLYCHTKTQEIYSWNKKKTYQLRRIRCWNYLTETVNNHHKYVLTRNFKLSWNKWKH